MCDAERPPADVAGALAMLERALDHLNAADVASLPASVQAEALRALGRAEAKHTAARARVAGRVRRAGRVRGRRAWHGADLAEVADPDHHRGRRGSDRVGAAAGRAPGDRAGHGRRGTVAVVGAGGCASGPNGCQRRSGGMQMRSWRAPPGAGRSWPRSPGWPRRCTSAATVTATGRRLGLRTGGSGSGITFGGAGRAEGDLTPGCAAALAAVLEALGKKAGPEEPGRLAAPS